MRLGISSANPFEWLLLRSGFIPTPLLFTYWGMSAGRTILTAASLGVFDALERAERPLSADEVAEEIGCDPFGTEVLLNALNGFRYVRRRGRKYRNAKVASRWIAGGSKLSMRDSLLFFDDLWSVLDEMTPMVRSGETRNLHYEGRSPEFWRHYLRGLAAFARLTGPEIARRTPVPSSATRLLDVGGGHGMYAAAYARRYPGLTAEVLDLPEACEQGRELIGETGLSDRVTFREGDARTAEWGDGYDVVLVFNLIHNLTPSESVEVLRRAHAALAPGGVLVVLEGEHEGTENDLSVTAGMNELTFYLTSGTRTYPEDEMRRWIEEAGFSGTRTRRLLTVPQTALLTATRA